MRFQDAAVERDALLQIRAARNAMAEIYLGACRRVNVRGHSQLLPLIGQTKTHTSGSNRQRSTFTI